MTAPTNTLLDRYQEYRVRRWLVHETRMAGMLPGWRTRHRRRVLVILTAVAIFGVFATGVLCAFDLRWGPLVILPFLAVFFPAWIMLRIASQSQDNAPEQTLDEWQIAQRNTARSIGLTITQTLTLVPVFYLIYGAVLAPEASAFRTAYAGGVMALATLLAGGCAPAMILGWNQPDPEPEA
ncbi:hypothetical protein AB0N05_38080 [Nocardia sp. NPDC051030]|uniref:hypothetical protein n=1 Tax=Nocardia sp. NPDC051030 TaxID=3155162 RepID=UPI003416E9F6